ncbi:MAG: helix-turn-helix domain-containing protein [Candidatus Woesearchaeota archaeon]|nr:helix-turn-helix domain-containing protein [Candidatus Woesearchaeota archaeon]
MREDVLKSLGLSDKEAKTYIVLLELGPSLASEVSKKTDIPRTFTYDILNELIKKGLASYFIKENRKYFRATDPENLKTVIEQQKRIQLSLISEALPELNEIKFKEAEEKPKVELYEGKEGVKTILNDILNTRPKEILVYGGVGQSRVLFPVFMKHWHKRRQELKIKFKVIYNKTEEAEERFKKFKEDYKYSEVKFLPLSFFSPTAMIVYKNKVALTVWTKYPFGILIQSSEISENYKKRFEYLWEMASKIIK